MKTVPLRQLVREPLKVKKWTRAGQTVQVTDNGKPLWIIKAASDEISGDENRRASINELLDDVLQEPVSSISLSKIVKDSR